MAELFTLPARATDSNGNNLSGAKLYFYATGTTTPQNVYSDAALSTSLGAVVTADSGGKFVGIYLDPTLTYRAILKTSDDVTTIYDLDPIGQGPRDFVSVSDYPDLATAVAQSGGRMVFGINLFRQEQTGAADTVTNYIHRTTTYTGGTPGFVNSALKIESDIGAGNANYEWGIVGVLNNSATAGENVAIYGQSNKASTGPTWAMVAEVRDTTGAATGSTVGIEIDVFANGADASNNRVAIDIVGGRHNGAGTQAEIGYGIRLAPQAFNTANAKFKVGFQMQGIVTTGIDYEATSDTAILFGSSSNVIIGIDFSQGTISGAALKFARTQRIAAFESTGAVVLDNIGAADTLLAFKVSGSEKIGLDLATPGLRMNATQVVGTRKTGWSAATGTATRTTFDTTTVTTQQLAERVKALTDDLISHGMIGA